MRAKRFLLALPGRIRRGAGVPYPWRCLCFGFSQMIRTTPFRRMTLHLAHILRTDGLTFITFPFSLRSVNDPSAGQIVRSQLHRDAVSREDLDEVHPHLPRNMSKHLHLVVELHPEHGVRERLDHGAFDFYCFFLWHISLAIKGIYRA
jgi:hypothetical protein